jgi:hypothetical protein
MHKNATKCNKTLSKWCKNKHGASKIIDTFETYQKALLRFKAAMTADPGGLLRDGRAGSSTLVGRGLRRHRLGRVLPSLFKLYNRP